MRYLIFFVTAYLIVYLFYFLFVVKKDKSLKKMKNSKELLLLSKLGKIDIDRYELKRVVKIMGLANGLIVAIMGTLVLLFEKIIGNFYLWIIVSAIGSIIVLIPLIIGIYKIIGIIIKRGN